MNSYFTWALGPNIVWIHMEYGPENHINSYGNVGRSLTRVYIHMEYGPRAWEPYEFMWSGGPGPEHQMNSYGTWAQRLRITWIRMESSPRAWKLYEFIRNQDPWPKTKWIQMEWGARALKTIWLHMAFGLTAKNHMNSYGIVAQDLRLIWVHMEWGPWHWSHTNAYGFQAFGPDSHMNLHGIENEGPKTIRIHEDSGPRARTTYEFVWDDILVASANSSRAPSRRQDGLCCLVGQLFEGKFGWTFSNGFCNADSGGTLGRASFSGLILGDTNWRIRSGRQVFEMRKGSFHVSDEHAHDFKF